MPQLLITLVCLIFAGFCHAQNSQLAKLTLYSKSLKELRELTVYFPENFTTENSYPVIFCADGQFINEQYKHKLDSLFGTKTVNPFVNSVAENIRF